MGERGHWRVGNFENRGGGRRVSLSIYFDSGSALKNWTGHLRTTHSTSHSCTSSWIGRVHYLKPLLLACGTACIHNHPSSELTGYTVTFPSSEPPHRYSTMCRFFAHLCLYLQMIDIPVPPLATQVILESYLQVLEVRPIQAS
jgi:hypothetical protein